MVNTEYRAQGRVAKSQLALKAQKRRAHQAQQKLQNLDNQRWCQTREKAFVADEDLAQEDIQNSKKIFHMIDESGEGSVTYAEMMKSFRFCGFDPDPVAIQEVVEKGDMDNSGGLNFTEFLSMTSSKANKQHFESLGKRGVPPIDAWVLAYNRRTALRKELGNEVMSENVCGGGRSGVGVEGTLLISSSSHLLISSSPHLLIFSSPHLSPSSAGIECSYLQKKDHVEGDNKKVLYLLPLSSSHSPPPTHSHSPLPTLLLSLTLLPLTLTHLLSPTSLPLISSHPPPSHSGYKWA
jgi:hypothetical protein